jgi:hypothetical protein
MTEQLTIKIGGGRFTFGHPARAELHVHVRQHC